LAVLVAACGRSGVYRYDSFDIQSLPDGSLKMPDAAVPDAGKPCIPGTLTLTHASPVAGFVIDRSSSMNDRFDTTTKWKALTSALTTTLPPGGDVDEKMQIGAVVFPIGGANVLACLPPGGADLTPALGNAQPFINLLNAHNPSGSTPTAGAIEVAAASVLGVRAATASRALVLATDGQPDCNASLNPQTCTCIGSHTCNAVRCLDDVRTIDHIAHYADAGLPTYVIGIAPSSDAMFIQVLNEMANAGGKPQQGAGTSFYSVSNEAELTMAFNAIIGQVGACVYLSSSVPNSDEGITVTLNGTKVPEGTGWVWTDRRNGEVTLLAGFCDQVTANPALPLDATISCDMGPK
jgi:hypothetical protein